MNWGWKEIRGVLQFFYFCYVGIVRMFVRVVLDFSGETSSSSSESYAGRSSV
jgi:hypothetical protein